MPQRGVSMRHIDEVLRLATQGLSQHEISTSIGNVGVSRFEACSLQRRCGFLGPTTGVWRASPSKGGWL